MPTPHFPTYCDKPADFRSRLSDELLRVPADSPYIDHPPRDLRHVGAAICLVWAVGFVSVLVRWVVV